MAIWGLVVSVAALAASPAAAAPGGSGLQQSTDSPSADSYVLSTGDNSLSTNLSLDEYMRVRQKQSGDFLWFRRAGKAYLIDDPATLAQARELFTPLRALEPEQEDLRRRQEALNEKEQELDGRQEDLERRMEALTENDGETTGDGDDASMDTEEAAPPTEAERAEIEKELADLRSQEEALRPGLREMEAKNRELETVERSLDAREDKLEKEAEAKLWVLIDDAVRKGLATPSSMP
jgi:hypothetical protein